jgi:antagonist of KipI
VSVQVLDGGLQTTLQDAGRFGHGAVGVGNAGPMDEVALRLANALVGNPIRATALEMTLVGATLQFAQAAVIALTGALLDARCHNGDAVASVAMNRPVRLAAGSVLECGRARRGARSYLAVAGAFTVTSMLGSAATDLNAALGPFGGRALRAGDVLETGDAALRTGPGSTPTDALLHLSLPADPARPLRLIRGSHFDALDPDSRRRLFDAPFRVTAASSRVGLRLEGPGLALGRPFEQVSAPVAHGTVQLPPGGQPIVLGAEHPTTGGYPRIAQVAAIDLPRLGQCRPGDVLRFAPIDMADAQSRYLAREHALADAFGLAAAGGDT